MVENSLNRFEAVYNKLFTFGIKIRVISSGFLLSVRRTAHTWKKIQEPCPRVQLSSASHAPKVAEVVGILGQGFVFTALRSLSSLRGHKRGLKLSVLVIFLYKQLAEHTISPFPFATSLQRRFEVFIKAIIYRSILQRKVPIFRLFPNAS